jgi:hypothetical protein
LHESSKATYTENNEKRICYRTEKYDHGYVATEKALLDDKSVLRADCDDKREARKKS